MTFAGLRPTILSLLAAPMALALSLTPAHAAGGGLPTLVKDMGMSLLLAGVIAVVFARLKVPSIAAFLLAGVVAGPQVLHIVTEPDNIEAIAQIGFVLLLFVIGLEINVKSLFGGNKAMLLGGAIQYPITLAFGMLFAHLFIWIGLGSYFEGYSLAPFYIGVAIAGSSSLLVVKLFQEHFELDTQPGRVALTILIFQDIWAILVTLLLPSLENPHLDAILFSFLGIGILLVIALVLARLIAEKAFRWIAKVPELVLLAALSWCFAMVAIGTNLDAMTEMAGFNLHMSVGAGMAALIAGVTIANLPFSVEIISKVGLVKDFFITLFFVGLGISLPAIAGWELPLLALLVALVAIIARQIVFFPLFYLVGIDQRSAQVASIRLAQLSEFGLVIAFLGLELGHISHEIASIIILAFVGTAVLTTPLFDNAYPLHARLKSFLNAIGFKEPEQEEEDERTEYTVAILGLHRDASSLLYELKRWNADILPKTLVVDFNVALHGQVRALGAHAEYGDISNEETLIHAGVDRAKIIVCTIPDDILRGITTQSLVRTILHLNPNATIIANAIDLRAHAAVEAAGADYVYMPRLEVSQALVNAIERTLSGELATHKERMAEKWGAPHEREEVIK